MHPYWLTLKNLPPFHSLSLGAGITAASEEEAREILTDKFGREWEAEIVRRIYAADEIEQNHVRPTMGNFLIRGVWFPSGYT